MSDVLADLLEREHHDKEYEPIEGVFTDVFAAVLEPPKWVIKDLLPPGLVFIAADPKSGKSTLTMAMAALVAGFHCKTLPPNMSEVPEKGRALIFSYEALAGALRHIIEEGLGVSGQADGSILIADDPWKWRLDEPEAVEQMLYWLNERKPRLVILDPFRNFHGLDEKDSMIIDLLAPLRRWAIENDSAFVVVHHNKKPSEEGRGATRTAYDMRGTSALFGAADAILMLTPKGKFGHVVINATFKRAEPWEKELQLGVWGNEEGREMIGDLDRAVVTLLSGGPMSTEAVGEQMRAPPAIIREVLAKLERNGLVRKENRRWVKV